MSNAVAFLTCKTGGYRANAIAMVLMGWALLLAQPAYADFTGKVVKVADGDTISVLRDCEQIKIRLAGIDAPEKAQPFGNVARQSMSEMVFGKEVRVVEQGRDRYAAELTPTSGDYGADLILSKDGRRIAVQAKRYVGSVGVAAVQEALSGMAYYQCHAAWVIATGAFTPNALELAEKSGVKMIGRSDIGNLMAQHKAKTNNG